MTVGNRTTSLAPISHLGVVRPENWLLRSFRAPMPQRGKRRGSYSFLKPGSEFGW